MNEEFTQRLAALEKKFQQAIREKEALRKQLEVIIIFQCNFSTTLKSALTITTAFVMDLTSFSSRQLAKNFAVQQNELFVDNLQ